MSAHALRRLLIVTGIFGLLFAWAPEATGQPVELTPATVVDDAASPSARPTGVALGDGFL